MLKTVIYLQLLMKDPPQEKYHILNCASILYKKGNTVFTKRNNIWFWDMPLLFKLWEHKLHPILTHAILLQRSMTLIALCGIWDKWTKHNDIASCDWHCLKQLDRIGRESTDDNRTKTETFYSDTCTDQNKNIVSM